MSFYDEFDNPDEAMENWKAKNNPPEYQEGQDLDALDYLSSPPNGRESTVGVDSFVGFTNPQSSYNNNQQEPQNNSILSKEDEIVAHAWKGFVATCKLLFNFISGLFANIKITTPTGWWWTYYVFQNYGLGLIGAGFFLYVLGFFISSISSALWLVVLGILCSAVGVSGRIIMKPKSDDWIDRTGSDAKTSNEKHASGVSLSEDYVEDYSSDNSEEDLFEESVDYESSPNDWWEEDDEEDEEEYFSLFDEAEEHGIKVLDVEEPEDVDTAIQELESSAPGMQSRQYLFEQYSKVLRSITPNFYDMEEVYPETELFSHYNFLLENAAKREGFTDDDFRLVRIYENSFMYKLVVEANNKFKADKVGKSIENQERFNDMGKEVAPNVMVTTNVIGGNVHIDILKNEPPKFTVKDVWLSKKEFFTDPIYDMPIALGSDRMGEPIVLDFSDIYSVALSGKPGMGKTWLAQAILSQLAFFNSPNQVQFVIADPKGKQGDFAKMDIPHVVKQVKTMDETMELLRWIRDTEIPRRESVLGYYDLSDIRDLKREYPDVELPYLYVVVEEMMSLGGNIKQQGSELYNEYKLILSDLVNKCRYLGIRLFALSQRMTNDAIPKDLKVSLGLKMAVGADMSEVSQALDIKEKDFPYNISSKRGKCAIMTGNYNGGSPSFMISSVLGDNNTENSNIYRYINALWGKLEPGKEEVSAKDAIAQELQNASSDELNAILDTLVDL